MKIIEKLVSELKNKNIEFEILKKRIQRKKLTVKKSKIEDFKFSDEEVYSLKILKNKKIGFTFFTKTPELNIENIIQKAIQLADISDVDDAFEFYSGEFDNNNFKKNLFYNKKIEELSDDKLLELSCSLEDYAYSYDKKIVNVKDAGFFKVLIEKIYINSNNILKSYKKNYYGAQLLTVSQKNNESYMGYEYATSPKINLNPQEISENAAYKAIRMIGAKKGNSLKIPILIENELVGDLLSILLPSFYIENIEKNKSILYKNKPGEKILNEKLYIIDDPLNSEAIGSVIFDDEGVETSKKILVDKGILNEFLYNYFYAKKYKKNFAGNSFQPSYKQQQEICFTNIFLQAGEKKPIEKNCLKLINLMGLHTADPISGDFSLGADAILYSNDNITPLKEIIISGNILDVFKNILEIYNDIKSVGTISTPSILVEGLKISGN